MANTFNAGIYHRLFSRPLYFDARWNFEPGSGVFMMVELLVLLLLDTGTADDSNGILEDVADMLADVEY